MTKLFSQRPEALTSLSEQFYFSENTWLRMLVKIIQILSKMNFELPLITKWKNKLEISSLKSLNWIRSWMREEFFLKEKKIVLTNYPVFVSGRLTLLAWSIILISKRSSLGRSHWFRLYRMTARMHKVLSDGSKSRTCVSL